MFGVRDTKLLVCICGHYTHNHTKWGTEYSQCRYGGGMAKYGAHCKCEGLSAKTILQVEEKNNPRFIYGYKKHRVDGTLKDWEPHYPLYYPLANEGLDVTWLVSECSRCSRTVSWEGSDRLYPWSRVEVSLQVMLLCEECNHVMESE